MELIKKVGKLLGEMKVCSVSAVTEDGFPRICVLLKVKNEGIKTVYFATNKTSTKVKHYRQNAKAGVTFYNDNDSASLLGEMRVIDDKVTKSKIWQDWLGRFFPNGGKDNPEYTILKFTSQQATIYIDNEIETVTL